LGDSGKKMGSRILFGDLKIGEDSRRMFNDIVDRDWASENKYVKEFEEEWGKLFGYKYNVMVTSGTMADVIACNALYDLNAKRSLDMKDNQIICPALAFVASGASIVSAGFEPVFVDIKRDTMNIDPDKIEGAITDKTRAIMVVHTMGKPADMNKIMEIARKHNLYVIEDSCEAHGARYRGKTIGNWGDMAVFSFYAAHLVCCGEGGMISTNNDEIANILKSLKSHGRIPGSLYFDHVRIGLNGKTTEMNAAIGLPQIKDFFNTHRVRRENLFYVLERVKDLEKFAWFNKQEDHDEITSHAFSVTLKDPKYDLSGLGHFLEDGGEGIQVKRNFGSMPTQHKAFEFLGKKLGEFPEAEYVGENGLHFGMHQYLSRNDLDYIVDRLHKYFERFQ
jgi:dTDP-4-amino-4,6-dideoxygalactose transaminase